MLVVLTGDDSFALKQALRARINEFVDKHGEFALEQMDADDAAVEHIFDAINSIPLLSAGKMVVVYGASRHKELLEKLADNPESVPESTELLLVDSKLDKRARYYKQLRKTAQFNEFLSTDTKDIASWAVDYAKTQGGELSRSEASYLAQRVGIDKTLLSSEIDKLVTFSPKVTRESIDLLCEPLPRSTVFQLLDAAFVGNTDRALELYKDQRKQRVEPLAILGMIAWQLQSLALVKTAGERSVEDIAREAKLNPFVVRKNREVASKITLLQLRKLVRRALELDVKLKSTAVDADEAMRYFLMTLSRV